jgi:hypothetical protein
VERVLISSLWQFRWVLAITQPFIATQTRTLSGGLERRSAAVEVLKASMTTFTSENMMSMLRRDPCLFS